MKAKKSRKTKAEMVERAKAELDSIEMELDAAEEKSAKAEAPKPEKKAAKTAKKAPKKPEEKKKGGRPPMSAAEKAAAAKARKEARELEAKMAPVLMLQFAGSEKDLAAVTEAARADFKAGNKRTPLTALTLYIKPEDGMAYYVANGTVSGKVPL